MNLDNTECKELAIYTTIEPQIMKENLSKIDITSTKLYDLEDQQNEVELGSNNFDSVLNLMEPLHTNNKDNILNNMTLTKDIVTRFENLQIIIIIFIVNCTCNLIYTQFLKIYSIKIRLKLRFII